VESERRLLVPTPSTRTADADTYDVSVPMRVVKVDFDGIERDGTTLPAPDEDELEQPLVLVIWRDAFFDFDQHDPEDCRPDYLVHTVGFLVSEGPRFVSLAQEVLPDGDGFRAVTHIPLSIIERVMPLQATDLADERSLGAE
jgi:hypothetical protein